MSLINHPDLLLYLRETFACLKILSLGHGFTLLARVPFKNFIHVTHMYCMYIHVDMTYTHAHIYIYTHTYVYR